MVDPEGFGSVCLGFGGLRMGQAHDKHPGREARIVHQKIDPLRKSCIHGSAMATNDAVAGP